MEEKIRLLEQVALGLGLSLQEVVDCWGAQAKVKQSSLASRCLEPQNEQDFKFPFGDIRSQAKLFWYAFEGGKFSPDPKAYPNCQGVVGWINPNPDAPEGRRIYVVLPEQMELKYSSKPRKTHLHDLNDGQENTRRLIDAGKEYGIKIPAAEYAYNYTKNGVKKGEAFWPAGEQLLRVCANAYDVNQSLEKIGGTFKGTLFSSSEHDAYKAWCVDTDDGQIGYYRKDFDHMVSFFIAY